MSTTTERNYCQDARDDAKAAATYFLGTIIEALLDKGEASDDLLNDYPGGDAYHHENHTDRSYTLLEAARVLDQLPDAVETDEGLWQGLAARAAIVTQAAYSYANAVHGRFRDLIKEINSEPDIAALLEQYHATDECKKELATELYYVVEDCIEDY